MKKSTVKFGVLAVVASLTTALYSPQALATGVEATSAPVVQKTDLQLAQMKGAIVGYPGTTDLKAEKYVTRAELVAMINKALSLPDVKVKKSSFHDLAQWQSQIVENAVAAGLVSGVGNGAFEPNREVTRQEMAVIIGASMNGGKVPTVNQNVLNYFKDSDAIASWAKPFVAYSTIAGIFEPNADGNFDANKKMTRGEAAKALKYVLFDVLDILTTNDIHGNIEVQFDKNKNQNQGGMETIGGIVNDFRAVNPKGTIVVDGGDAWQGTLISNLFNGESVIESMEEIKYDAMAIGNHEFDFGRDVLINNIKKSSVPIISANVIEDSTGKLVDWTKPYVILDKGGVKVGVIGFSTPQTSTTTKSTNIEGLSFPDPAPIAKKLSEELKAQGVDVVIVTSHLPGEQEKATKEIMGELVDLANGTGKGYLDAIVGGHSHQRVAGHVNGIPVVEASQWTWALGHIQLFVDKDNKGIVSSNAGLLETYTNLTTGDAAVKQIVKGYKDQVAVKEAEVQGIAATALSRKSYRMAKNGNQDRDGVTALGMSITDSMRKSSNSDIAFTNAGGVRADVDAGEMTYGEMFAVLPFGNVNMTGTMTSEQVKRAVDVIDKYSKLIALQWSGINVEWDGTRPAGDMVTKITLTDGTPIYVDGKYNTDRTFKVTTNDFMATGTGDGYLVFGEVKDWQLGDVMLDGWVNMVKELHTQGKQVSVTPDGRDIRTDLDK
ncbi:multifunctional 2',3'-cyclic-nucleotide 2'-phosphodiesterase/5'-nucleotidase/3'-nucleotidase [Tumebacillus algifaecis]|uniref:Multifunctional 2',3'-cyclic-nucleotide 2'-phosphodiesterase/5'-nucleotidase/3'-nucleotidase n=1 Tax=Tumebacillus algifaecis TaxID=1214604 RepID=A0A223D6I7_9BACL|nr:5'-nucleotidase C-terminal domain-containing protein [Tumebacillus algifaecis]ASS76984.1 multifunctional 2',3'-cyclic-nucleotide 2'-phosphodiesterase/5'-nucleotidase/3'-nucleotidase [Tumebacillus algifaecis]